MSHQSIAGIWVVLHGRRDIDNILREIVGQYSLDISKHREDREKTRTRAFRYIVALRAIFDLQRAYLQSSDTSSRSQTCLAQPHLLLSILSHLLEVKETQFCASHALLEHDHHCSYIGQTLLSGLRSLMLHPTKLSRKEYNEFTHRFDDVWSSERLCEVDHFTINRLCHRMLAALADESHGHVYSLPACGVVKFPDFYRGLYPIEQTIVNATQKSMSASYKSSDWLYTSLVLYDIFWNVRAASIQFCMHFQTTKRRGPLSPEEVNSWLHKLDSVNLPYLDILDTVYRASYRVPSSDTLALALDRMRTLLCLNLSPSCIQIKCSCMDDGLHLSAHELWLQRGGQEVLTNLKSHMEKCQYLVTDIPLKDFRITLEARSTNTPDMFEKIEKNSQEDPERTDEPSLGFMSSAKEPKNLSLSESSQYTEQPHTSAKGLERESSNVHLPEALTPQYDVTSLQVQGRGPPQKKIYSSRSHNLHSIEESSHDTKFPNQLTRMQRFSSLSIQDHGLMVRSNSNLQKAPSTTTIFSASTESTGYPDQLSRPTSGTYTTRSMPTQEQCTALPEVVNVATHFNNQSPKSMSIRSGQSRQSSRNQLTTPWSLFKSNKGGALTSSVPTATFFASGRTLLLWNELGAICYELDNISLMVSRQIISGDVQIAAGGTRKCAVITRSGSVTLLRTFMYPQENPVHEMELEEVPFKMAISSNDHYIALKYGSYVRIVDTLTGKPPFYHKLPSHNSRCGPSDHLITFSTDCLSFVASTRFEPEKVISYFCDCRDPSLARTVHSSAPYGLVGDCGLSAVVCSNNSAFLTTFTEKGYPVFLSFSDNRQSIRPLRDKNQQVGSRIHGAALCATAQNLVMMNDQNEIFWINDPFGKEQAPVCIGKIKKTKSVKRDVEIAIPDHDEVHLFWTDKRKGILVTMGRSGGKSKPVDLNIDMNQLVER